MSSTHVQRLPGSFAPAAHHHLAGLRAVAQNRLSRAAGAALAFFTERTQGRADAALLAHAQRSAATHPKLARELRSYVRGGSSY